MFRCPNALIALAMVMAIPIVISAQTADNPPTPGSPAQPARQSPSGAELLKSEQIEALVAPIALYPDELVANVLAASTYPLEVVQADRWLKANKSLKGDGLKKEVEKQTWDDSVKALTSTADVISMMSDKVDWTKNLGDAVLAQQGDVMDAIQSLRSKAYDSKKLVTTKQQKVSVQSQENKQAIVIEPTDPDTIYVPYYDPATVYGDWPYADYPPYDFGYPSYIGAGAIAAGLAFGTGWAIARWGNYWGGGANWGNRNLYVNQFNRTNNVGNNWQHNPAHRQGVRYNNANVQQRFGNNNLTAGAANRMDFRGRDGQQVGSGDRAGNRAGDLGGDRAASRDRAGGDRGNRTADRAKSGGKSGGKSGAKSAARSGGKGGGNRATAANRGGSAARGSSTRASALNVSSGRAAFAQSARGQASLGGRGGGGFRGGGGGGGGFRGGGGGGRGGGGGGRRSDIALKHDIVLLGHLANGVGYYRFSYLGSQKAYVGVMAQEVQSVMPDAVTRGSDGYLRVHYEKLGLKFRTYDVWLAGGAKIPGEVSP